MRHTRRYSSGRGSLCSDDSGRASRNTPDEYDLVLDPHSNTAPICKRYVFQIWEAIGLRGDACYRIDNVLFALHRVQGHGVQGRGEYELVSTLRSGSPFQLRYV